MEQEFRKTFRNHLPWAVPFRHINNSRLRWIEGPCPIALIPKEYVLITFPLEGSDRQKPLS